MTKAEAYTLLARYASELSEGRSDEAKAALLRMATSADIVKLTRNVPPLTTAFLKTVPKGVDSKHWATREMMRATVDALEEYDRHHPEQQLP